ncbi:alpha/beta fold hydrolase [Rothia sp. ZJ1223]|uniref:alpha/beta fold hydrolase n=1 Tax=Rothia sp. ZJ1223 TaxID=2811098 RepID=UPI00351C22C5
MVFEPVMQSIDRGSQRSVQVLGSETHYWVYGSEKNPLAVLVHGFRGDHHGLELIAQKLSQSFHVVIPDLPGFGVSESIPNAQHSISTYASWLVEFIATLSSPPQVLVGHSFGSIVCTYAAASRPGIAKKLSLINPISEPALEGQQKVVSVLASSYYSVGASLPEKLGFGWLRLAPVTRASSRFMMRTKNPELRDFIDAQHDAHFGSFSSRATVLEAYRASISETAAYYAPALPMPTQMIVAEDDDLGSLATARAMYTSLNLGRMDVIERVGHLIHYETPQRAATLIKDFVKDAL